MKIILNRLSEHWRMNGFIANVVDQAAAQAGLEEGVLADDHWDSHTEHFSENVAIALEDAGHEVVWTTSQSIGNGVIVQGPRDQIEEANQAFSAACEQCREEFYDRVLAQAETEAAWLKENAEAE